MAKPVVSGRNMVKLQEKRQKTRVMNQTRLKRTGKFTYINLFNNSKKKENPFLKSQMRENEYSQLITYVGGSEEKRRVKKVGLSKTRRQREVGRERKWRRSC